MDDNTVQGGQEMSTGTKHIQISIKIDGTDVGGAKDSSHSDQPSEMEAALKSVGLDPSHWSSILKKELRVSTPQALEALSEVRGKATKDAISKVMEEANDWEKAALDKLLKGSKKEDTPKKTLEGELEKAGLDGSKWVRILKDKLGVTTLSQAEHVGDESYNKLVEDVEVKNWEKKALRAFFKMETEEQKHERRQKQQEKANQMLKDLKALHDEGKTRNDEAVKKLEQDVREKLDISDAEWIPNDNSLADMILKLESKQGGMSGTLMKRKNISEKAVVQTASSGLALRGFLHSKNIDEYQKTRHSLLKVPEDIHLDGPIHTHHDIVEQFDSKDKEDHFTKNMEKHGYSVYASVKAGYAGVAAEVGGGYAHSKEEEKAEEKHEEETYTSIVKYSILPLASFSFGDYQLQLSDDALSHLRLLENDLHSTKAAQECEDFLQRFGSHVYTGPLHFGGIYGLKSYTSGFKEEDKEKVKNIQSQAVSASVGLSVANVGGTVSTTVSDSTGKATGEHFEHLKAQTFLDINVKGGPPEVTDLGEWKTGIVSSNSTWALIDRGIQSVAVWDVIKMNHVQDFKNPNCLVKVLESVWKQHIMGKMPAWAFSGVTQQVALWADFPDETKFESQLKYLLEQKRIISSDYMSNRSWPTDFLSQTPFQRYLQIVYQSCLKSEAKRNEQCICWKHYLSQILEPMDLQITRVFPDQMNVSKWLHDFKYVAPFQCHTLESVGLKMQEAIEIVNSGGMNSCIEATALVAMAIRRFRQKNEKITYELVLLTVLFPFQYDPQKGIFSALMTKGDLKYLYKSFKDHMFRVRKNPNASFQSYLFKLAVKLYDDLSVSEACFENHIAYLESRLGENLDANIAKELHCRGYSWSDFAEKIKKVPTEMRALASEDEDDQKRKFKSLLELVGSGEDKDGKEPPESQKPIEKNKRVFSELGLSEWYPQKLTHSNALQVRESTLETDVQPDPFSILQKYINSCHKVGHDETKLIDARFLALLHCCDNFLRRDILRRLSSSYIAVPLLLPDPISQKRIFLSFATSSVMLKDMKIQREDVFENSSFYLPHVSLMGIGQHHSPSKSHFMNTLISTTWILPFPCRDVDSASDFTNGLVEFSCYIPSKKDPIFPNAVSFSILHGDACKHLEQVHFLSKVCCMHILLLNVADFGSAEKVLNTLSGTPAGLLILQTKPDTAQKSLKKMVEQLISSKKPTIIEQFMDQNIISTIQQEIRNNICRTDCPSLVDSRQVALSCGIQTDEELVECETGKALARDIEIEESESPSTHLVVSSHLWHKWAKKDRQQYQQNFDLSIGDHVAFQRKQMELIRKEQVIRSQTLSRLMTSFISCFLKHPGQVAWYFLHWLNAKFDALTGDELLKLQTQYWQSKSTLKNTQHQQPPDEYNMDTLTKVNVDMKNSFFGLNDLFREMGQMYEAVTSQKSWPLEDMRTLVSYFPDRVARFMVGGLALELMDGDIAHVPTQWISAILDKVSEFLKSPEIFVLSVLGLQSTGKSTLLNAMFGTQFSVGIGRCTRGALMQLLPVDMSLQKSCGFQYVLVIDTEGLGAPEHGTEVHRRDNEMATFVMGVSNTTIFNIEDNDVTDLLHVLQPTLHALLRMKEMKPKARCMFVSQNKAKVTSGIHFVSSNILDGIAQDVAKAEGFEEYRHFTQIIEFDNADGWYAFSNVWSEDSLNLEYCAEAQKVKSHLLQTERRSSIVQLKQKIPSLRRAILQQRALFGCRNSLEIATLKTLENHYSQWLQNFEELMVQWEKNVVESLTSCPHQKVSAEVTESLTQLVKGFEKHAILKMKNLLRECSESEQTIVSTWVSKVNKRLTSMLKREQEQAIQQCKRIQSRITSHKNIDFLRESIQHFINNTSVHLVKECKFEEEQLNDIFEDNWIKWMTQMASYIGPVQSVTIKMDVERGITNFLGSYHELLMEKLYNPQNGKSLEIWGLHMRLRVKKIHLRLRECAGGSRMIKELLPFAQQSTDNILRDVQNHLDFKQLYEVCYHYRLTSELLLFLFQKLEQISSDDFYVTSEYKVDMALTVCGNALHTFEEMFKAGSQLELNKESMKKRFVQNCSERIEMKSMAETIINKLRDPVYRQVKYLVSVAIAEDIRRCCPWIKCRQSLITKCYLVVGSKIMEAADTEDVVKCIKSLIPEKAVPKSKRKMAGSGGWDLQRLIRELTIPYISDKLLQLKYQEIRKLVENIQVKVHGVSESFVKASKDAFVHDWLIELCGALKGILEIEPQDFSDIEQKCYLDVSFLGNEIIERLSKDVKDEMNKKLFRETTTAVVWNLLERLTGCCAKCPFCKQECNNPVKNHASKHTAIHRPFPCNDKLLTCTEAVRSEETSKEEGKEVYPNWDIIPCDAKEGDSSSMFWKWIIGNFKDEAEKAFAPEVVKFKNIPSSWKDIAWEDVKEWLEDKLQS